MGLGKMRMFIHITSIETEKDSEAFGTEKETIVASLRAYKEDRYASERWANRATFSEATALFRFRGIPGVTITSEMVITCDDGRYEITSVRDIKNRGMYVEVLAKKVVASSG